MAIRSATPSDVDAVAAFWTKAYVTLGIGGRSERYSEADFLKSAESSEAMVIGELPSLAGAVVLMPPRAEGCLVAAIALWGRAAQIAAHRLYESARSRANYPYRSVR